MSLLNENPVRKESFLSSAVFKWIVTGIIFFSAATLFYLTLDEIKGVFVKAPVETPVVSEGENKRAVLPTPPLGADMYNYGLSDNIGDPEDLEGSIIFTTLQNKDDAMSRALVYHVSARNPELGIAPFFPDFIKYSAFFEPTTSIKPNAFFADAAHVAFSNPSPKNERKSTSVQKYDFSKGSAVGFDSIIGEKVSNLSWSENTQKIAYTRQRGATSDASQLDAIENWEVVIANTSQDLVETVLEGAVSPKWSPDGSVLLFLRNDGLYSYTLASKVEERLVPIQTGKLSARSMIDINSQGTYLLWSFAQEQVVITYKINSWEPVVLSEIARLHNTFDGEYVAPVFSPDGNHYALLVLLTSPSDKTEVVGSRIETHAIGGIKSLSAFSFGLNTVHPISLDAWIADLPEVTL